MDDTDTLFIFYDLETTGRSTKKDKIVQIAASFVFDNKVLATFSSYVCPDGGLRKPRSMAPGAARVTGIRDKLLLDKPSFNVMWTRHFMPALEKATTYVSFDHICYVGYNNWRFDDVILTREIADCGRCIASDLGVASEEMFSWDVFKDARLFFNKRTDAQGNKLVPNHRLGTIYEHITGEPLVNAHDALSDVDATFRVSRHSALMQSFRAGTNVRPWQCAEEKLAPVVPTVVRFFKQAAAQATAEEPAENLKRDSCRVCVDCGNTVSVYFDHVCVCEDMVPGPISGCDV